MYVYNLWRLTPHSCFSSSGIFTQVRERVGSVLPVRQTPPICIVMLYYTSQASLNSSQLFLLVGHCHTWSAANGRSGLYGCVGHGYVAEVVLADSLDGVCVCRK